MIKLRGQIEAASPNGYDFMFDTVLLENTTPIPDLNRTIGDFWSWAYSNLLTNTIRCTYGEYLVAAARRVDNAPRTEWTPYDLVYRDTTIEVKTSGYLQTWHQKQPSTIAFDIAPRTHTWIPEDNVITALQEATRVALLYVFCIHTAQLSNNAESAKPEITSLMGTQNWRFYAVPTFLIDHLFEKQKQVRFSTLEARLNRQGYTSATYEQLKSTVDRCVDAILGLE
jgi:hypothetical protein